MSAPVLSWLFIALGKACASQGHPKGYQKSSQREPQSLPAAAISLQGLLCPILRANPFSEGTDLFCRLPLSTLFYRLEAANLEDLMRLCVRPGVQIKHATEFSRDVESATKHSKVKCLSQHSNPISDQFDSRDGVVVKKKRKLFSGLPPPSPVLLVLPLNIHFLAGKY